MTVREYLMRDGRTPKYIGFTYLADAIEIALQRDACPFTMDADILPILAEKYGKAHPTFLQAMQRAIKTSKRTKDVHEYIYLAKFRLGED